MGGHGMYEEVAVGEEGAGGGRQLSVGALALTNVRR